MTTKYWEVPVEEEQAIEITIGAARVAWTENDDVYLFVGVGAAPGVRDDGYTHIGVLEWEESADAPVQFAVEEAHNLERLREFYLAWKAKTNN